MKKLVVKEATINNAPGVDAGDQLIYTGKHAFSDGINLVIGPNGVGKSTTARALQAVLFGGKDYNVAYKVDVDGDLFAGHTAKSANPQLAAHVPADHEGKSFIMSLNDLSEETQGETAGKIDAEALDGIRLDGLDTADPKKALKAAKKAAEERNTASNKLDAQRETYARFSHIEDEIALLKKERKACESQQGHIVALEALQTLHEAEKKLHVAEDAKEPYKEIPRDLRKDDHEQLTKLYSAINQAEQSLHTKQAELDALQKSLTGERVEQRHLALAEEIDGKLVAKSSEREIKNGERSSAQAQVDHLQRKLGTIVDKDLDYQALAERLPDQLDTRLTEFRKSRAKVDAATQTVELLDSLDTECDPDTRKACDDGIERLTEWLSLAQGQSGPGQKPTQKKGFVLVSAIICGAFACLGFWYPPAFAMIIPCALLVIHLMTAGRAEGTSPASVETGDRVRIQEKYDKLGLKPIETWSEQVVGETVRELADQIGTLRAAESVSGKKEVVMGQKDMSEKELAAASDGLKDLRDLLELTPDQDPEIARLLVDAFHQWHATSLKLAELTGQVETLDEYMSTLLASVNEVFKPTLGVTVTDPIQVKARIDELRTRISMQARRDTLSKEIPEIKSRKDEAIDARDTILERLSLDTSNALHTVGGWMPDFEAANRAYAELDKAEQAKYVAENDLNRKLEELSDQVATEIRGLDKGQLETRINANKELGEQIKQLTTAINDKEHDLNALRDPQELLKAEQTFQDTDAKFVSAREKYVEALVASRMVELLTLRCKRQSSPTHDRADKLFSTFTNDNYGLAAEADDGKLVALTRNDPPERKTFSQLSSGTQVQMLLAARLAFLERMEEVTGTRMPLFLDEVLCNSDDDRMEAIIDAVMEIAKQRQVFYFTAQLDEIEKWKALASRMSPKPDVKELVLPLSGRNRLSSIIPGPVSPPLTPAPNPDESWSEYGERLDIPPLHPFNRDLGELHVWHMIHDPHVLYSCLKERIKTWGQFKGRCERLTPDTFLDTLEGMTPEAMVRIEAVAECLRMLWSKWWIGRAPRLDRISLANCGITESFIDCVAERCERKDIAGDPKKLLQSLRNDRLSGFGDARIDKFEEGLKSNDYLKDAAVLTPDQLAERLDGFIQTSDPVVQEHLRSKRDWMLSLFDTSE